MVTPGCRPTSRPRYLLCLFFFLRAFPKPGKQKGKRFCEMAGCRAAFHPLAFKKLHLPVSQMPFPKEIAFEWVEHLLFCCVYFSLHLVAAPAENVFFGCVNLCIVMCYGVCSAKNLHNSKSPHTPFFLDFADWKSGSLAHHDNF